MNATKKLSAGAWLSIVTCVLSLAALVAYLINTSAAGYFQNATVSNLVLMVVGAACFFYFALNAMTLVRLSTRIETVHVIIGVVGILILMELCRRCVGLPILCVAGVLIVYAFINQLSYAGAVNGATLYDALKTIIYKLFYTTSGVIGTPINVCYTYIVLFIIFGAFLERTGIANFFISFANRLAGWSSGGPAKVAVISSALCGMVSGSSVGNTVTTGSFTIPMMKKTGYKPEFAGAVEAAASTGGQIMPPIMGAAAFLMAEYMKLPYAQVAVKAILPALLYFTGIFIAVHLEAKKLGLKGVPREELPAWRLLVRDCYLIIPLILLVWLVSSGSKTMSHSAAYSILAAIAVGFVNFFLQGKRGEGDTQPMTTGKALGNAVAHSKSVDNDGQGVLFIFFQLNFFIKGTHFTVNKHAHVASFAHIVHYFYVFALAPAHQRCHYHKPCSLRHGQYMVYNLLHGLPFNQFAAFGAVRLADTRKQQP